MEDRGFDVVAKMDIDGYLKIKKIVFDSENRFND